MKKKKIVIFGLKSIRYCYIGWNLNENIKPGHRRFKVGVAEYTNGSDRSQKLAASSGDFKYHYFAVNGCSEYSPSKIEKLVKLYCKDYHFELTDNLLSATNTECFEVPLEMFDRIIKMFNFLFRDTELDTHPLLEDMRITIAFFRKYKRQYPGPAVKAYEKLEIILKKREKEVEENFFGYDEKMFLKLDNRLGGVCRSEEALRKEFSENHPHIDLSGKE